MSDTTVTRTRATTPATGGVSAEERAEASRQAARDRVRSWAKAHPERVQERRLRYRELHPERAKASERKYYATHKEQIAERARERLFQSPDPGAAQRRWREANRERAAQIQRGYRANPAVQARLREQNNQRSTLRRRLKELGLPAPRLHRSTVKEQHQHRQDAEAFFARVSAERPRRVKVADEPTPPHLLARWAAQMQEARTVTAERAQIREHALRHQKRLREEIGMDNTARRLRGASPLDPDRELIRRATDELRRAGHVRPAPPAFPTQPPAHAQRPAPARALG